MQYVVQKPFWVYAVWFLAVRVFLLWAKAVSQPGRVFEDAGGIQGRLRARATGSGAGDRGDKERCVAVLP